MGKKSKMQRVYVAADAAKSPEGTPIKSEDEFVVKKKASDQKSSVRRRSGRLQSIVKPVKNQVVEQIDLLDSEKEEDDQLHVQNENHKEDNGLHVEQPSRVSEPCNQDLANGPTPNQDLANELTPNQKIVDERVDHLKRAIEGKSEGALSESTSVGLIYKSLYLDSQKKIEALTSENHALARKLKIVLANLEVMENINKSNQEVIVSKLEKAIKTLVRPASYFGGHISSNGGDAEASGGGAVAKESSAKKQRYN